MHLVKETCKYQHSGADRRGLAEELVGLGLGNIIQPQPGAMRPASS